MKKPLQQCVYSLYGNGKAEHMHEIAFGLNVFYYIIMFGAVELQKKSNLEVVRLMIKDCFFLSLGKFNQVPST